MRNVYSGRLFLLLAFFSLGLFAQAGAQSLAVNGGAVIRIEPGLVVSVEGTMWNQGSGRVYNSGTLHVADTLRNDAANGMFIDTTAVGFDDGVVVLEDRPGIGVSADQVVMGNATISFQTLRLRGNKAKSLIGVDAEVRNEIDMLDREFKLNDRKLTVLSTSPLAISYITGFFSNTYQTTPGILPGRLVRNMLAGNNYSFPMGNTALGAANRRPVYVSPAGPGSFSVYFSPTDPVSEGGYAKLGNGLCKVNDAFFHYVEPAVAGAQFAVTVFYDASDPQMDAVGGWMNMATPEWSAVGNTAGPTEDNGIGGTLNSYVSNNNLTAAMVRQPVALVSTAPVVDVTLSDNGPFCASDMTVVTVTGTPALGDRRIFTVMDSTSKTVMFSGTYTDPTNPTFVPQNVFNGTSNYWAIFTFEENGCTVNDTARFKMNDLPDGDVAPASATVCAADKLDLTVSPTSTDYTYSWTVTGQPGASFSANNSAAAHTTRLDAASLNLTPVGGPADEIVMRVTDSKTLCFSEDQVALTVISGPKFDLIAPTATCEGLNGVFRAVNVTPSNPAPNNVQINWSTNLPGVGTGTGTQYAVRLPSGGTGFQLTVVASLPNSSCLLRKDTIINALDTPSVVVGIVNLPANNVLCEGKSFDLRAGITGVPALPVVYTWSPDPSSVGNSGTLTGITQDGNYAVSVLDANGCVGKDDINISFRQQPTPRFDFLGEDTLCGNSGQLYVSRVWFNSGYGDFDFAWSMDYIDGGSAGSSNFNVVNQGRFMGLDTASVFSTSGLMNYPELASLVSLTVTNKDCPDWDFTADIAPMPVYMFAAPVIESVMVRPGDTLSLGQTALFDVTWRDPKGQGGTINRARYIWDWNGDYIADDSVENRSSFEQVMRDKGGRYARVWVTNVFAEGKGCTSADSVWIYVDEDLRLDIPSAFAPGHRMANDTWDIMTVEGVDPSTFELKIYDRWGNFVKGFDGSILGKRGAGWDGTYADGSPAPEGVYVFHVKSCGYTDSRGRCHEMNRSGTVTVLR